jgi:tetratricopeptide (TPR) repeat protein
MSFKAITSSDISPFTLPPFTTVINNANGDSRIDSTIESIRTESLSPISNIASSISQFTSFQSPSNLASNASSSTHARTILKAKRRYSRSIFRVDSSAASIPMSSSSLSTKPLSIFRADSMADSASNNYPSFSTEASKSPSSTPYLSSSVNSTLSSTSSFFNSSSSSFYPSSQSSSSVSNLVNSLLSLENETTSLFDLANNFSDLFEKRNYADAITAFNLLEQKINSSRSFCLSSSLFYKAGISYFMKSNGLKALQLLTKAGNMDPTNLSIKTDIAITVAVFFPMTFQEFFTMVSEFNSYYEKSNYPKAIEAFEKLIQQLLKVNPQSAVDNTNSSLSILLRNASFCYAYQTNYSKALHYLRICSDFEGSPSVETKLLLATTLYILASTRPTSNIECCSEFLEAHQLLSNMPDSARQIPLIDNLFQANRLKLAIALIDVLLSKIQKV